MGKYTSRQIANIAEKEDENTPRSHRRIRQRDHTLLSVASFTGEPTIPEETEVYISPPEESSALQVFYEAGLSGAVHSQITNL